MIGDNKEDFIKSLIVNAIESGMYDLYKKWAYCHVISSVTREPVKLGTSITDTDFFRRYQLFLEMMKGENRLDYLGADMGDDDIYRFDAGTCGLIFGIEQDLNNFIGIVTRKLQFGEIDMERG